MFNDRFSRWIQVRWFLLRSSAAVSGEEPITINGTGSLCWPHLVVSVMQWSGVRPSVCPNFFLTIIECAAHTQRESPGGSMQCSQRTFQPNNETDQNTCFLYRLDVLPATEEYQTTDPNQWPGFILASSNTGLVIEETLLPLCRTRAVELGLKN